MLEKKNPDMEKLGQVLLSIRKEKGFSVREAAKTCGITPSYLSKLERGVFFNAISIHTLVNLARIYDMPLIHLLQSAGFIQNELVLPDFPQYLRLKHGFSVQGIKDMEMAKDIVERKYGIRKASGPQVA